MPTIVDSSPPPASSTPLTKDEAGSASVWLGVLLALALGVRLMVLVLGPAGQIELAQHADSPRYIALAGHLIQEGVFALQNEPTDSITAAVRDLRAEAGELEAPLTNGLQAEIFRMPGYPVFLAAFQWIGLPVQAVLVAQCVLGALCVLLVYLLTRSLLKSSTAGLIAAAIMALHPGAITLANVILPDVLWLTLVLSGLWLMMSSGDRQPIASMGIGGLLLGTAVLIQPYSLVVFIALAIWMVLRQRTWRSIAPVIVMLIMANVGPGLWMLRNHLIGFEPSLSSEPVIDRYFHTVADMRIASADTDSPKNWPETADTLLNELATQQHENETVFGAMDRLTQTYLHDHRLLYAQLIQNDAVHFFTDHSLATLYQQLGLRYESPEVQKRILTNGISLRGWTGTRDDVAVFAALLWTLFNATLFVVTIVGLIIMLVRGRWLTACLLVAGVGYLLLNVHDQLYERPHMMALGFQAAIIAAIVAPPCIPVVKKKKNHASRRGKKNIAENNNKPSASKRMSAI